MPPSRRKMYVNNRVGAQGLNVFDTSRSIQEFQARTYTNMIPTIGGSKIRFGFNIFNQDLNKTGGIPMLHGYNSFLFTPAFLTGGSGATSVVATWNAVLDGSFRITIDGVERIVTGLNFAAAASMANVATIIQTGIRALTLKTETVVWSVDRFIITSASTYINSAITVLQGAGVGTNISGLGGTAFMDGDVGNGVVTNKVISGKSKQIIFANDDDYYYLEPTDAVDTPWNVIGDYGTASSNPHAYTSGGYVIFGSGIKGNSQKKFDGLNFTNITSPAIANVDLAFFEFFQGQDFAALFGAGDLTHPSRLYYSDSDNPDNWSTGSAGFIDIALDDGFGITGLKVQGEQLIIYKEKKKYYVSTFYESDTGVYGIRVLPFVDSSGGTLCHDSIQVLPSGDIVALGHKEIGLQGIGKLQAADGSLVPKDYSRDIYPLFEQLNYNQIEGVRGVIFKKMLFFAVPFGKTASNNNYVFVYHTDSQAWTVIPDLSIGSWLVYDDADGNEILYAGDSERPIIYKFDENEFTDNGEAIFGTVRTGKLNLGSIIDYEDLQSIVLEGSKLEGDTLKFTFVADDVETTYEITDNYLASSGSGGGFIAHDYIAEEYTTGEEVDSTELRWLAILLVSSEQRKAREIEIQIENTNLGANFSWNYLSINEFDFNEGRLFPEKNIIANESNI